MDFFKTLGIITKKITHPEKFAETDTTQPTRGNDRFNALISLVISCLYAYFFYIYIYMVHPTLPADMKHKQMLNILAWISYVSNIAHAILSLLVFTFI